MSKARTILAGARFALAALLLTACAGEGANDEAERDLVLEEAAEADALRIEGAGGPLAKFAAGDRTVTFYEPVPGTIIELEVGEADEATSLPDDTEFDAVKRYELLSGARAPQALAEAQQRADLTRKAYLERGPSALQRDELDRAPEAHNTKVINATAWPGTEASLSWFLDNFCVQTDRFWFTTGISSTYKAWGNVNYWKAGVYNASSSSSFDMTLSYNATYQGTVEVRGTLPARWYAALRASHSVFSSLAQLQIIANASDNLWQACVNYHY